MISDAPACNPMDTQIFNLKLSVMGTSAYILITALAAEQTRPTLETIREKWNAVPEALDLALKELLTRNVIERHDYPSEDNPSYTPNPASMWR